MSAGSATVTPAQIGALEPPRGVTPNFTDPYSLENSFLASGVLCLTLATLSTAIRLYTKLVLLKTHGWEDYTMIIAWGGLSVYWGLQGASFKYGVGIHQWDVLSTKIIPFAHRVYTAEILYNPLIAITKLSICLQLIRIFVVGRGRRFWCIIVFLWANILYFVAFTLITIFQCIPIAKIFDPEIPGRCLAYDSCIFVNGVLIFLSDLLMLLFPLVWISRLKMSTKRRLEIAAVFFIGTLGIAASTLRIVFSAIDYGSHDMTFQLSRVGMCTTGEITAGILAGNLVVSPRFFSTCNTKVTNFFSRFRGSRSSELIREVSSGKTSSVGPRTQKAYSSAPWSDQHSASRIPGQYMELNDQGYKVAVFASHESNSSDCGNSPGSPAPRDFLNLDSEASGSMKNSENMPVH